MWFDEEIPVVMQSFAVLGFLLPSNTQAVLCVFLIPEQTQISKVKYISITVLNLPLSFKDKPNFNSYIQIKKKSRI